MGTPETTTYAYSADGLVTTQFNPDGGTIVTESYPDGRTKSVTGTATIARHYTYDKHNENGGGQLTIVSSPLPLGTEPSGEIPEGSKGQGEGAQHVSSYSDLAGRTYKQTRTAPHGQTAVTTTIYNTLGQVETVASSGQPTVKYLYNAEGDQIATWTDRNGDGQFNDGSNPLLPGVKDSCTTTQTDYLPAASAPAGLGDCRRTTTTVRTEANEDKIVSTTWQSVDGLRSRQETLGVASPSMATRTRPLNGASSSTQTNPDGTSVVTATTILANGNTQTTSSSYSSLPSQSLLSSVSSITDALGRTVQTTNGRGHITTYSYHDAGGQTASITQVNAAPPPTPGNLVTSYTYTLTQGIGRSTETTLPDASKQYQETNLLGQTTRQWGSQTNPVTFTYDAAGRMATHTTFRTPVTSGSQQTIPSSGDTTRWEYDPSGVLLRKIYADENKTTYTYDIAGRLATRVWARGITTSYGYTAGQLTSIDYSDATPDVSATYNRLGQLLTANQSGAATSLDADYTFGYNANTLRFASETITIDPDGSDPLPSLTRTIDRTRDNLQRPTGFVLGNEHAVGYGYDVSGRLATISAQGLPNLPGKSHAFEYTYEPGSSLLDKVTGPVHEVDNTYETHRNVLSEKKNARTVGTPGELSVIGYTVNELGQRAQRNLRGEIRAEFYGGQAANQYSTNWGYDALGQVTSEDKPSTIADRGYTYDLIGNRLTSTADGVTTSYSSNALNQYSQISVPSVHSVVPIHDQDGNMTIGLLNGSTTGQFEYDGANQLIRTQSTATSDPTKYAYDAFGRRVVKATYPNAGGQATAATLFIYDGWNLIAEYKLDSGAWTQERTYTWGIDLSGSTQGAGGVGGILTVTKHEAPPTASGQASTTHFYPIYDGNGNVEAYLDSNGTPAAIYQYDAFGNVLSGEGVGASDHQGKFFHRFSTKYQDAETGLLYYGYRYSDANTGRWLNRDPIGEPGGINIYGFVGNGPIFSLDPFGLAEEGFIPDYFQGKEGWIPDYFQGKEGFVPNYAQEAVGNTSEVVSDLAKQYYPVIDELAKLLAASLSNQSGFQIQGDLLEYVKQDPAMIAANAKVLEQLRQEAIRLYRKPSGSNIRIASFNLTGRWDAEFGGKRAGGNMLDQFLGFWKPQYRATWAVGANPLTWVLRHAGGTYNARVGVAYNCRGYVGTANIDYDLRDKLDLRPHKHKPGDWSVLLHPSKNMYDAATIVLGAIYHDALGRTDSLVISAKFGMNGGFAGMW
jgi:RHS repeat-associated protein